MVFDDERKEEKNWTSAWPDVPLPPCLLRPPNLPLPHLPSPRLLFPRSYTSPSSLSQAKKAFNHFPIILFGNPWLASPWNIFWNFNPHLQFSWRILLVRNVHLFFCFLSILSSPSFFMEFVPGAFGFSFYIPFCTRFLFWRVLRPTTEAQSGILLAPTNIQPSALLEIPEIWCVSLLWSLPELCNVFSGFCNQLQKICCGYHRNMSRGPRKIHCGTPQHVARTSGTLRALPKKRWRCPKHTAGSQKNLLPAEFFAGTPRNSKSVLGTLGTLCVAVWKLPAGYHNRIK